MARFRSEIVIAAPPEVVFDHLVDSVGDPPRPGGAGATLAARPPGSNGENDGAAEGMTLDRPKRIEMRAEGDGFAFHLAYTLEQVADGTKVVCQADMKMPGLMGLVLRFAGATEIRELRLDLMRLKETIEGSGDSGGAEDVSDEPSPDWPGIVRTEWVDRGPPLTAIGTDLFGAASMAVVAALLGQVGAPAAPYAVGAAAAVCVALSVRGLLLIRQRHPAWDTFLTISPGRLIVTRWRPTGSSSVTIRRTEAGRLRRTGFPSGDRTASGQGLRLHDASGREVLRLRPTHVTIESRPDWLVFDDPFEPRLSDLVAAWWPTAEGDYPRGGGSVARRPKPGEPHPFDAFDAVVVRRGARIVAALGAVVAFAGGVFASAGPNAQDRGAASFIVFVGFLIVLGAVVIPPLRARFRARRRARSV